MSVLDEERHLIDGRPFQVYETEDGWVTVLGDPDPRRRYWWTFDLGWMDVVGSRESITFIGVLST